MTLLEKIACLFELLWHLLGVPKRNRIAYPFARAVS